MKLAKYRFDIRPRSELILPTYKGSTFRGGFGHAFKRAVCVDRAGECAKCALPHKCVYSYVFETLSWLAEVHCEAKWHICTRNYEDTSQTGILYLDLSPHLRC